MGLLDFNIAEFVSRAVRGGGVRGRVRPTLDDGILQTVRIGDWSQAPYRTDERRFFGCISDIPFVGGQVCIAAIENASPLPVIIECVEYVTRTATAMIIDEVFIDRLAGFPLPTRFSSGEGSKPIGAGAGVNFLPLVTFTSLTQVAGIGGGPVVRRVILTGSATPVPPNRADRFDFMIPPGCSYCFQAVTVAASFGIQVRLRAPQQVLPS